MKRTEILQEIRRMREVYAETIYLMFTINNVQNKYSLKIPRKADIDRLTDTWIYFFKKE